MVSTHFLLQLIDLFNYFFLKGYEYTFVTDRLWRKTRSLTSSSSCRGVDPNRNFGYKVSFLFLTMEILIQFTILTNVKLRLQQRFFKAFITKARLLFFSKHENFFNGQSVKIRTI
jgi:hypothetical protein